MQLMKRISRFVSANINSLLDEAEDPEKMVKQLIRDMEESIAEVRRATVRAVARHKHLEKQIESAAATAAGMEERARLALSRGEDDLARQAVRRRLQAVGTGANLAREAEGAAELAAQLKADLVRLEDQVQAARRKRDELIRRSQAAAAQRTTQEAARRSTESLRQASSAVGALAASDSSLGALEDDVARREAEAEAERELLAERVDDDRELDRLAEEHAVEQELRRLRGEAS